MDEDQMKEIKNRNRTAFGTSVGSIKV